MLNKSLVYISLALSLFLNVLATPASVKRGIAHPRDAPAPPASGNQPDVSFNDMTQIPSLSHFDDFFGKDNFNGNKNDQVVIQEKTVQCKQIEVTQIQQRLAVLREMVKKVIVQQVCEVEVQTLVLKQFQSGVEAFSEDVRHTSVKQVSFDESITSLFSNLQDSLGNLSSGDLGFSGSSIGNSSIIANGSNWNDKTSPASVGAVYNASKIASKQAQGKNATAPLPPSPPK